MPEGEKEKNPCIIYFLTISATLGGLLFGYDTGIISGAIILINDEFGLTSGMHQLIVASTVGSAAIFSLFSGIVADAIGRKGTIMVSAVIFTIGGVCMGVAAGPEMIILGRFIVGAAIGFVSSVVPVYISECAPISIRGLLITMNQLFITIGIVISSVFAGAFQGFDGGWRIMLGAGALPGVIQFIFFLGLPESPRYQLMKSQEAKAEKTLKQIRNKDDVKEELSEMKRQIEEEKMSKGWAIWQRIFTTPHIRKALFIGCMLQLFQQFCGINAVIYYSSTILMSAGFSSKLAIWLAVVPTTINFLATFIGLWAVESLGRKLALALSFLAIGGALLVLTAGFLLAQLNSPEAKATNDALSIVTLCNKYPTCHECISNGHCGYCYRIVKSEIKEGSCVNSSAEAAWAMSGRCSKNNSTKKFMVPDMSYTYNFCPSEYGWLAVLGMVLYVLGFAPGAGPMPWTINAEIYPQWGRSIANSLAAVTNWTCNVIVSYFFLTLTMTITAWGTFLLFCGVCIVGAIFVLAYVPETKDKSLEEVELLFMTEAVRKETLANRQKKEEEGGGGGGVASPDNLTETDLAKKTTEPSFTLGASGSTALT
ncbi:unnamed protein product [Candidula unifasciata]|uniref:Major facilitator superfamily (MFS) profile domain-containing protein n=1 Tax=Candidula unifasciata TaxID=100452 RepID=A0A8S3YMY8_9EUPU|nr:unnamed protein product [Candidula unifasciata]